MTELKIEKINQYAKTPSYQTQGSACFDLSAAENKVIEPGSVVAVTTGLKMQPPPSFRIDLFIRSSLGSKGIMLANGVGKIDNDYRGEVKILLYNSTKERFHVNIGDRIAQAELNPIYYVDEIKEGVVNDTKRGEGGFGSTGVR